MPRCAYSCTQYSLHTQFMLLTHTDASLCLQLHTAQSLFLTSTFPIDTLLFLPKNPTLSLNTSVPVPVRTVPFQPFLLQPHNSQSPATINGTIVVLSHNSDVSSMRFLFLASLRTKGSSLAAELQLDIQHGNSNPVYCSV